MRTRGHAHGRDFDLRSRPSAVRFLFRGEAGPQRPRETRSRFARLATAAGMAGLGSLVLRPWIRELVLGSEALSSPRAGQLLKVSPHPLLRARRPVLGPVRWV